MFAASEIFFVVPLPVDHTQLCTLGRPKAGSTRQTRSPGSERVVRCPLTGISSSHVTAVLRRILARSKISLDSGTQSSLALIAVSPYLRQRGSSWRHGGRTFGEAVTNGSWRAISHSYPKLLSGIADPAARPPLTRHVAGKTPRPELASGLYMKPLRCPPFETQNAIRRHRREQRRDDCCSD